MKYNDNGEWKDVQIKVANAIQNEYGESNNDGYSQNYLNDKVVNVSSSVDEDYKVNVLHSKNLTDGIWENGGWSSTGEKTDSPSFTRTANPIYVKPNTTYTLKISRSNNQIVVYYYSASGYIDLAFVQNTDTYTFTTPANCVKINFRLSGQGISYTDTMINEGSTALPYEPFIPNQIVVDNEKYSDTLNVGASVDSRSRVNVLKSNNLLDLQFLQLITNSNGTVISNNSYWDVIVDTRNISSLYISGNFSLLADNTVRVGTYSSYPVLGSTGTRITLQANGAINTSNVNYVLFAFGVSSSSVTWDQVKASFMINEGSTALPYEPYIVPSIYVDDEEIYNQNIMNYSSNEQVIGTFMDRKLYRKVLNCGAMPNNTYKQVAHNISNLDFIISLRGTAYNTTHNGFPLPYVVAGDTTNVCVYYNSTHVTIVTASDRSSYGNSYLILEYLKTTD